MRTASYLMVAAIAACGICVHWLPGAPTSKTADDGYGELVYVPAGTFQMGDNFGEGESRERPVHRVELDAFFIGKYEVTNGQFRKFRDDAG